MKWEFSDFVFDAVAAELTGPEGPVHIERSPLRLLQHLIENRDRVVSKDDLIEAVWEGRIVSEATISTAIKQVRKAVGDTGADQNVIRTLHGRGFRFVAPVDQVSQPARPASDEPADHDSPHSLDTHGVGRPSIAVLRFLKLGESDITSLLSDALPTELITALSRTKWLHVIARGSSFRFDPGDFDYQDVGRRLNVRYLMTGIIENVGDMLTISLEIQSAENGGLVWSDRFSSTISDVQLVRSDIVAAVISALEISIPQYESLQSRRLSPDQFDAWSHFHLGLSHIFKFSAQDNLLAARHFQSALDLDKHFARAHAGLSFTHWQNGFMEFRGNRQENQDLAFQAASRALDIDADDPFVNFNMGRAQWLMGEIQGAQAWLDRAIQLNPNYAQCHYNRGLVMALDGQTQTAHMSTQKAYDLSPLDPLAYGMFGVRAMSAMIEEDTAAAVSFADQAMRLPGTHFYIACIAALAHEMNADRDQAIKWRDHALAQRPDLKPSTFFAAFPFVDPKFRARLESTFARLGIAD